MAGKQADVELTQAQAEKARVEAQLEPQVVKAKVISALSNNLDDNAEGKDFEQRARIADLMLKEKSINSDERIAKMQMSKQNLADEEYIKKPTQTLQ